MPAKRSTLQTRTQAVRLYRALIEIPGQTKLAARREIGRLVGVSESTLRHWVEREASSRVWWSGGPPGFQPFLWRQWRRSPAPHC